ncbi:hypothetical protein DIU31_002915 [Mucilaginibacter rubeus]|uniref:Uncharacterized protein n=1 Tax=Mucilaginibacter rubeus TaxID=2027860 RepID=A0AAE6JBC6_9SPHI|nr:MULTISPECIES: hypothetical protein [Mucilaginibacter]QEM02519.1 hypothetical protein DIU31_002915 [Mucilaginibacter rubeus]QEM15139.1 hypothetical protein DIU38_002940 [Mucilaginibacter gossypii]QTE42138.1 hypothetical protein J3L19_24855 [Mucilaginibacter rubeus]QTE48739.1 hypothetical protein J3L21_24830 [Mucilaginibacter rubeus]QTE53837.1 hypothetical protein J3L23_16460 [Mucilaginibacter rubeus]
MKNFLLIIIVALVTFSSCRKLSGTDNAAPGNNNPNYDANNRIFRVKASSTAAFKLSIIEYGDDGVTPYNTQSADQSSAFDYGFTPVIGHKISVSIQSANGKITAFALYKNEYLDPIVIKTNGSGSTADFSYTVKN